jgi:anion-transporting  ArsA/GET3 family ATPase
MQAPSLLKLFDERRVLVVAGAGGVGKTTVAAGIALSAASRGRRVLCLTIDPAKRLADRLGLDAASGAEQRLDPSTFEAAGLSLKGDLTLVMLDTKRTFDDLIRKHASSPEAAKRILENEFYEYVSTQLAGTQAYMAMETVLSVLGDPRYDLVVLDTPPTSDALDFLDAPQRLIEVLDSAALRWLAQAFERSGRFSLNLVARGVALVLRGIARLTGQGFLERLAEFVTEVNELFGGFKERAERVARAFRGPEFAYLLVATPIPEALAEACFFAQRLTRLGMRADALIVNRTHELFARDPSADDIRAALRAKNLEFSEELLERIERAHRSEAANAERERSALEQAFSADGPLSQQRIPLKIEVPAFAASVHDVAALVAVSRRLA